MTSLWEGGTPYHFRHLPGDLDGMLRTYVFIQIIYFKLYPHPDRAHFFNFRTFFRNLALAQERLLLVNLLQDVRPLLIGDLCTIEAEAWVIFRCYGFDETDSVLARIHYNASVL